MCWATLWAIFPQTHLVALATVLSSLPWSRIIPCLGTSPWKHCWQQTLSCIWNIISERQTHRSISELIKKSKESHILTPGLPDGILSYQILVYLGSPWDGKVWCLSWPFGFLSAILVCFMAIWYFCGHLGKVSPILVCCAKKNLATLPHCLHLSRLTFFCINKTSSYFNFC
jgi:hypothetical protein